MGCQCPPCWGAIFPPPCDLHNPPGPRSLGERVRAARSVPMLSPAEKSSDADRSPETSQPLSPRQAPENFRGLGEEPAEGQREG